MDSLPLKTDFQYYFNAFSWHPYARAIFDLGFYSKLINIFKSLAIYVCLLLNKLDYLINVSIIITGTNLLKPNKN